jgi:hypothetical protein
LAAAALSTVTLTLPPLCCPPPDNELEPHPATATEAATRPAMSIDRRMVFLSKTSGLLPDPVVG